MAEASERAGEGPAGGAEPEEEASLAEASVQAFRDALERSVTLSRDRIQEVVDDAVHRGRMTRGDANELVSRLVTRGREGTEDLLSELERLLAQAGREVGSRTEPARKAAGRAARAARDAAEERLS